MALIADNLKRILEDIENIRTRCHLSQKVRLVAVSKTFPAQAVREAYATGQILFGENKVQEAEKKIRELSDLSLEWHLVGHLQTNKARKAAEIFDCIHSVDSLKLAEKLSAAAHEKGKILPVLLQVNTSGEASKSGLEPDLKLLSEIVGEILEMPNLRIDGFMTIGPLEGGVKATRKSFQQLREIRDALRQAFTFHDFPELSMGMSGDYEIALQEGATLIRLGSAVFGSRSYGIKDRSEVEKAWRS